MHKVIHISAAVSHVASAEARFNKAQAALDLAKPLYYAARKDCAKTTTEENIRVRGEAYSCYQAALNEYLAAKSDAKTAREEHRVFSYNQKPSLTKSGHALRR